MKECGQLHAEVASSVETASGVNQKAVKWTPEDNWTLLKRTKSPPYANIELQFLGYQQYTCPSGLLCISFNSDVTTCL
jgi:hypothetical protein